ncbi:LptE family protein [Flavobacterium salilacus subsp. salilacus]|uniref:LptE family protein n=1 Tax=Flavobacterium TaxID=237 RepID=UPI001075716D|nr:MULTISPECIES: LptE family protein [Flavobacterium]KAF2519876.1 LptE family protein [Flavobacterium salilacus subsp. salilacus]MBE1614218.1 LptE family protein [Flavobacterium sp. SaA2.13]NDI97699.1 LptE family protein [Flavobacterium salilacus subsp. altitudinum]
MKKLKLFAALALVFMINGCSIYNFTGTGKIDAETFQVNYFQNNADIIEPGVERTFTQRLQELIQNQTNLSLTNTDGDLVYEGEITQFRITPMTATADQRAAQNRLSVTINVRFTNKKNEEDDFEKPFSFFYDYPANDLLSGQVLNTALDEIFERITQDIFNESLAKW